MTKKKEEEEEEEEEEEKLRDAVCITISAFGKIKWSAKMAVGTHTRIYVYLSYLNSTTTKCYYRRLNASKWHARMTTLHPPPGKEAASLLFVVQQVHVL